MFQSFNTSLYRIFDIRLCLLRRVLIIRWQVGFICVIIDNNQFSKEFVFYIDNWRKLYPMHIEEKEIYVLKTFDKNPIFYKLDFRKTGYLGWQNCNNYLLSWKHSFQDGSVIVYVCFINHHTFVKSNSAREIFNWMSQN